MNFEKLLKLDWLHIRFHDECRASYDSHELIVYRSKLYCDNVVVASGQEIRGLEEAIKKGLEIKTYLRREKVIEAFNKMVDKIEE